MAAIYQWFVDNDVIVTTTLYPAETQDGVTFSISLASGALQPIDSGAYDISNTFKAVNRYVILITGEPDPEQLDISHELVNVTLYQILIAGEPDPENMGISQSFLDINRYDILITAYHPENGINFTTTLDSTACYLNPI